MQLLNLLTTTWHRMGFNFTALPLLAWIEVIIRVANNLLNFILTTSFGVEYNFLNFCCKDSLIVLLNVSWRPKWLSNLIMWLDKRSLSSGFSSDTGAWRRASCFSSLIIDPLEVSPYCKCYIKCWSSFEILQLVLGIKGLKISTSNLISMEPSSRFKLEMSSINRWVS